LTARIFAMAAHGAVKQVRKHTGEPYHNHPQRVRAILEQYVKWATPAMLDAADLHDVMEDTGIEIGMIRQLFGTETAHIVHGLSNVKARNEDGTPKYNRAQQKMVDAIALKSRCRKVKTIKLADKYDNLTDMIITDPKFAPIYVAEARYLLDFALKDGDEVLWAMVNRVIAAYYAENPQHLPKAA
jgi:(p)ppGpp synthase/HD superfamily hydrolase